MKHVDLNRPLFRVRTYQRRIELDAAQERRDQQQLLQRHIVGNANRLHDVQPQDAGGTGDQFVQ